VQSHPLLGGCVCVCCVCVLCVCCVYVCVLCVCDACCMCVCCVCVMLVYWLGRCSLTLPWGAVCVYVVCVCVVCVCVCVVCVCVCVCVCDACILAGKVQSHPPSPPLPPHINMNHTYRFFFDFFLLKKTAGREL